MSWSLGWLMLAVDRQLVLPALQSAGSIWSGFLGNVWCFCLMNRQQAKRIPWISRNFYALDGYRDESVTLEELWNN